jgi:hypothetical protein
VLLALNVWYFLARSWESSYVASNYSTIYYPTDVPVVQEWEHSLSGAEATVAWDAPVTGWRVLRDGESHAENEGRNIIFPVEEGDMTRYTYTAIPLPEGVGLPLTFTIQSIPESYSVGAGVPRPNAYYIRTNVPNAVFKQYPVAHWIDDYGYLGDEALAEIDRTLREEAGVMDDDPDLVKMEKIMAHLRSHIGQACRGTPAMKARWMNPWEIYNAMKAGELKGWCTQFAQMYVMLTNRAGLQTRFVFTHRTVDQHTIFTGHAWHETWIAEQGRWAWGDAAHGLIIATDREGKALNSIELHRLRQHAAWDGVDARVYKDWEWTQLEGEEGSVVTANFSEIGQVVENQFNTHAIFKWRQPPNVEDLRYDYGALFKSWDYFRSNLVRYYFKAPLAYADYPMEGAYTYYIRHLLLWGFLIALVGWWWKRR